jgi:hypothetical protein
MTAAHPSHEVEVDFLHELHRETDRGKTFETVLEGDHVVRHLAEVFWTAIDDRTRLGREKLAQRRRRTLDPA